MGQLAIQINELKKHYPGAEMPALQDLNLEVRSGIIAGLLGPNGAGKTTTISILCGLLPADSGRINIFGLPVRSHLKQLQAKIGVVPQQIALYPELTARENFTYISRLYRLDRKKTADRINDLLEQFGLTSNADKRISRFSGGMKRRANIIAGLLHEPHLLILDEPTAGVDVQSRTMILDFLKRYNRAGHTIIYTSHAMEEAERICDEVAIIDSGRLIAQDSPAELIRATTNCRTLEDVFLYHTGRSVRE